MESSYDNIMKLEKKRICAKMNGNKPIKNIANFGIKKNGYATVERHGEYSGLTIQVLDDLKPLLTNYRISNAYKQLEIGDLLNSQRILCVNNPSEVYYVMYHWLTKNGFIVPEFIKKNYVKLNNDVIDKWICLDRSIPLTCKFRLIDIGFSKNKHPVVPEDWIGKVFDSACDLHTQMDNLEWRKDKPNVRYCCTFGMTLIDDIKWGNKDNSTLGTQAPIHGICIKNNTAEFIKFDTNFPYTQWLSTITDDYDIIGNSKYIIACKKNEFFNTNPEYSTSTSMGILVSQLQKCIRRGPTCAKLLSKTIRLINSCRPYNLPEHNFMKVSGSKQLLWRLYISTIEDSSIYTCDNTLLSLDFIFALAMICHIDGSLQLNGSIIDKIVTSALQIQTFEKHWNWREGKLLEITDDFGNNTLVNSIKFALFHMPMMKGDANMLKKSISHIMSGYHIKHIQNVTQLQLDNILENSSNIDEYECQCDAIDMHCFPNIILLTQASLPFVGKYETRVIPKIIWDHISKKSFRYSPELIHSSKIHDVVATVSHIQEYVHNNGTKKLDDYTKYDNYLKNIIETTPENEYTTDTNMNKFIKRLAFLLIFGKKFHMQGNSKFNAVDIIVGGNEQVPLKIKKSSTKTKHEFLSGEERFQYEKQFLNSLEQPIKVILPNAPNGYKWKFDKDKIYVQIQLEKSDKINMINHILFYVDGVKIPPFDGSSLLLKVSQFDENKEDILIDKIIRQALYTGTYLCDHFDINLLMRRIWYMRKQRNDNSVYKWSKYLKDSGIHQNVWRIIYSRLISGDTFNIGPVDRSGDKTINSISYEYEGTLWRIMNLLAMLYPETINLSGTFKFAINKNTAGFNNILNIIQTNDINKLTSKVSPSIETNLWDHQKASSDRIFDGIINDHKPGHCDASCVGSGKTLVALTVISKIMNHDICDGSDGVLILLPTEKLYDTWKDEIKKHCKNFIVCEQSANGSLNNDIKFNSIVITTLGRMRDHPLIHKWLYVVIDECLSVQNSSSLHTEEAWRQVTNSKYGVLLLSASFFRSRFDKLLYMLRMLRTGLPEDAEYLDTLLNECLVCFIEEKNRKWITSINKFDLPKHIRDKYMLILNSSDDYETKYIKLNKVLFENCDYVKCFKNIIDKIEEKDTGNRALIYARSKKEADEIAARIKNVSRYPDKTKKHVVLSYSEGTYGLNDLVIYNTIITRPPEADKLPQMKGRLDRPNQKNNTLYIEYLLYENTIEEAMIHKLEMSKKFHGQYILPLAEFYKIAIENHN